MEEANFIISIIIMVGMGGMIAVSIHVKYKIEKARMTGKDISQKTYLHKIITKLFIREHPRN